MTNANRFYFLCRLFVLNNMFTDVLSVKTGFFSDKERLLLGGC